MDAEDPRFAREVVVDVTRDAPGSDAVLADLGVFVGPEARPRMVPAFDPAVFEYAVQITFESTGAYVVPVARDEMYKEIRVNTKTQLKGAPSATYPVAAGGKSIIKVVVTAHDNAVKETYTITVSRDAPNANAFLKALDVTEGTLRPPFSKTTFSYALGPISHASPSVRVLAEPEDAGDGTRVEVNGKWTPNGALSAEIPIAAGYGNGDEAVNGTGLITIVAWAQDGSTSLTYRVEVTREPPPIFPNDASLRALATEPRSARLSPPFDPNTRAYRLYVPARETSVRVRPIANDANAYRVAVNGVDVDGARRTRRPWRRSSSREDVELLIEVFANDCDRPGAPRVTWRASTRSRRARIGSTSWSCSSTARGRTRGSFGSSRGTRRIRAGRFARCVRSRRRFAREKRSWSRCRGKRPSSTRGTDPRASRATATSGCARTRSWTPRWSRWTFASPRWLRERPRATPRTPRPSAPRSSTPRDRSGTSPGTTRRRRSGRTASIESR